MSGKMEHDDKLRNKIEQKLSTLPSIFHEFYLYMDGDGKSLGTIKHYIEYTSDFANEVTHNNIDNEFYKSVTVQQIREYLVSLRRTIRDGKEVKASESIQATRWSAMNTFYNFLVMDDYIDVNPMAKTKRPKDKKEKPIVYLETNEVGNIMNKIKEESQHRMMNRDLAIVTLGITTGIRVGALVQIDIDDIDFKENTIHVFEKGHKERYLQFGQNARNALSMWLIDRQTYFPDVDTNALFISQWKQRITEEGVRKLMKKYADGIDKKITPHVMRKTAATQACRSGASIEVVAKMLGHDNINTTLRYRAILDEDRQKATNALDKMFEE